MQGSAGETSPKDVSFEIQCSRFSEEGWATVAARVPVERELTIYINQQEFVTILCTPSKLNFLVLGFLYSEGIISGMDDVMMMRVCDAESEVDVRLKGQDFKLPTRKRLTSGCGGGPSFTTYGHRVESDFLTTPLDIISLLRPLQEHMDLYRTSG
ncbi:MAG: formate dehydrogenase accessory sulfurtransferase FdhD, partial [Syntrophorhabdaceae bacterium]|nr:formate dehydrogenase accessory sulfurtransferase FdhD [Syntrophorhabdaceae bacterium]